MFKNLFKRSSSQNASQDKEIQIFAPIDGEVIALESVEDPVFAQKMVGDGIAILPTGDTIVSPVAGTLTQLFPTGHAAGITTPEGIEVLIHVGLDTVELKGEGFTKLAEQGQQVQVGTPLVKVHLDVIKAKARSIATPIIITNMPKVESLTKTETGQVQSLTDCVLRVVPAAK